MRASDPNEGGGCGSVREALVLAGACLDYLNSPQAATMDPCAVGEVLTALGDLQDRLAAAHATFLRRFDAADAHDADGYGSSSAWLAAKGRMTRRDARAAVRQMRQFSERPELHEAVAAGDLSRSWADAIARWTAKLPAELREAADRILLQAAAAGASLEDLATIAAAAIEQWRSAQPDPDDDFDFRDRYLKLGLTFGGAGVIRGDLTPECAAAVTAVLEALGKRRGPEDDRNEGQRFHDALAEACHLLLRARLVPGRAGADTQVTVHVPISQLRQMPGAADLEDAWLRARLGESGDPGTAYLTGKDAEVAACDALTVPVVTGHADMTVIDKIIRARLRRPRPAVSRGAAGPPLRHRPPRHRLRVRPRRPGLRAAHRAARAPLQHPVAPPGHRRTPTRSPGTSAARSCSATGTAPGPAAATAPPPLPTCTTSGTRATAARPRSRTAPCTASSTTRPASTAGAGRSPSTPTAPWKPAAPTAGRSSGTTLRQTGARHDDTAGRRIRDDLSCAVMRRELLLSY